MKKTIDKIINFAVKFADPELIMLFGSMSNGTASSHSDIDLLIIVEDQSLKYNLNDLIENYARELSLRADVLVYSRCEISDIAAKPNSFTRSIIRYGKEVYRSKKNFDFSW